MKNHIIYLLIILGMVFYLIFGNNGLLKYNQLLEIKDSYEKQIVQLEKKISELEKRIDLLKRDKEYMEETIKKELNMVHPNEDLYIINEKADSNRDNSTN